MMGINKWIRSYNSRVLLEGIPTYGRLTNQRMDAQGADADGACVYAHSAQVSRLVVARLARSPVPWTDMGFTIVDISI